MNTDGEEFQELLRQVGNGNTQASAELFGQHRDRLRRMVQLRLDRRLLGRLDPSDVLQDAYLEFSKSLAQYLREPDIPIYLWMRMITARRLQALHRHHLGFRVRDADREVSLYRGALPRAESESLAAQMVGRLTTPSGAAVRAELQLRVQEALNSMEPLDREILSLRHFEQLSNSETAQVLEISEAAASNRFVRALRRLKSVLMAVPGLIEDNQE